MSKKKVKNQELVSKLSKLVGESIDDDYYVLYFLQYEPEWRRGKKFPSKKVFFPSSRAVLISPRKKKLIEKIKAILSYISERKKKGSYLGKKIVALERLVFGDKIASLMPDDKILFIRKSGKGIDVAINSFVFGKVHYMIGLKKIKGIRKNEKLYNFLRRAGNILEVGKI